MKKLNENIRDYRIFRNLTQQEMAQRLGKSKNVISNWERGDNSPNTDEINKLCNIFECTPNQLLGWEASPEIEINMNIRRLSNLMRRAYSIVYRSLSALDELNNCKLELEQFEEEFESEYEYASISVIDFPIVYEEKAYFLYYVLNEEKDKVKIGISADPLKRAKSIQTSSGEEIELLQTIEFENRESASLAESYLHSRFNYWRKRPSKIAKSCEWFDASIVPALKEEYWTASQILEEAEAHEREKQEELSCVSSLS